MAIVRGMDQEDVMGEVVMVTEEEVEKEMKEDKEEMEVEVEVVMG